MLEIKGKEAKFTEDSLDDLLTVAPNDALSDIAGYLRDSDLASLAATSKNLASMFGPTLTTRAVSKLLLHVAYGEQDQAEALLRANPALALASGSVTDLSERRFANITAFQYALWAMDWHMWTMLLKHLPKLEAAAQARALEEGGTEHDTHFNLNELPQALDSYIENYDRWNDVERIHHWCKVVGGAQRLLPVHVVNEYCRPDRWFDPTPTFTDTRLPRTRVIHVNRADMDEDWFSVVYGGDIIGDSFAVTRSFWKRGCFGLAAAWQCLPATLMCDRSALQSLSTVRTQQLASLLSELSLDLPAEAKQGMP